MESKQKAGLTRREFLSKTAKATAGLALGTALFGAAPYVARAQARKITVGVGGWAVEPLKRVLAELDFTKETGIEVDVQVRPGSPPEFISQMTSAVRAGTSPYDVVDLEDEASVTLAQLGWLDPLDGLLPGDFWDDFPADMMNMVNVWHRHRGETVRIPHNYEPQYFWYRKDWFDRAGLKPPETWEELVEVGKHFTRDGVWGLTDALAKGAYLNVFMGYLTVQAGGNLYDFEEPTRMAFQFAHDLIHKHKIMPQAVLNKDNDAINVDYMGDRVAMMRQWPYFWDVSRGNTAWWTPEKTAISLPPKGPGNMGRTYAAAWGWSIPKTAPNKKAAQVFLQWIVSKENAPRLAPFDTWFLNARHSVLSAMGDRGMTPYMRWYSESGAIGTRPFHPRYMEALSVVEDLASAYLTNQLTLDEVMKAGKERIARLG